MSAGPVARREIPLRAHAKLTWNLRVVGVRDDGFHLIDAEMVSLDLHDLLVIDSDGDGLSIEGRYGPGTPVDRSNLVARALDQVGRTAHVHIDKRIPHGGGLGGGSSDAASVLRWAAREANAGGVDVSRYTSDTPTPEDLADAARLGADIAFCLVGGRARVRGIGELVDPLPHVVRTVTLVVPPLVVSTPAVYRAWDELGGPTADGPNDLEPAALAVEPSLATWRDRISELVGQPPILAGSGATWFSVGEHQDALAELIDEGAHVIVARTVPASVAVGDA